VFYPDALNASSQLMLGTLRLEGTENAVTAEQAKALLPLWQVLEAGGLQSGAERSAVLKQIEGEMSSDQLQAIALMRLSPGDMRTWAQEQGVSMGSGGHQRVSPDGRATPQAHFSGGNVPPEMATRRAQMENMSEEERAAFRATAQAGGGFGGRPGSSGAGVKQPLFLLRPLVELLEERAGAEGE